MKCAPGDLANFNLSEFTLNKLTELGIKVLFPVQYETFNFIMEGFDVVAQAHTGTGKTLAFALPLVEKLQAEDAKCYSLNGKSVKGRLPRVVVLTPTRELATQVAKDFENLITSKLKVLTVYGGVHYDQQESRINKGVDVIVGTTGRVKDLLQKGTLAFDKISYVVLDEVDTMLDMGFVEDVNEILATVYEKDDKPQTLLFSATMPKWINKIAKRFLQPADKTKRICLVDEQGSQAVMTVQHLALKCLYKERASTIADIIRVYGSATPTSRSIVFCETKKEADELATHSAMNASCHVLHGDIPQDKREMVLNKFREGKYRILVTTNVAARGLDICEVDLVIQAQPPVDVESYIHRSGRTGRAGRSGVCICFFTPRDEYKLKHVEVKAGIKFKRIFPPNPHEICEASAKETVAKLVNIPEQTLKLFTGSAKELIESMGGNAERAVAATLAQICGKTDMKPRSVLSSRENFVSYHFQSANPDIRGKAYLYAMLRKSGLSEEVINTVSYVVFTKARDGFVFDIPAEHETTFDETWSDSKLNWITKITTMPEVEEFQDGYNKYNNYNHSNGYSNHNGYNNHNNGYNKNKRGGGNSDRFGGRGTFNHRNHSRRTEGGEVKETTSNNINFRREGNGAKTFNSNGFAQKRSFNNKSTVYKKSDSGASASKKNEI